MDDLSGLDNYEVWSILKEVYHLKDDELIDEVLSLDYRDFDYVKSSVNDFLKHGELTKEDRDSLIGFYILQWYPYDIEE